MLMKNGEKSIWSIEIWDHNLHLKFIYNPKFQLQLLVTLVNILININYAFSVLVFPNEHERKFHKKA